MRRKDRWLGANVRGKFGARRRTLRANWEA